MYQENLFDLTVWLSMSTPCYCFCQSQRANEAVNKDPTILIVTSIYISLRRKGMDKFPTELLLLPRLFHKVFNEMQLNLNRK